MEGHGHPLQVPLVFWAGKARSGDRIGKAWPLSVDLDMERRKVIG